MRFSKGWTFCLALVAPFLWDSSAAAANHSRFLSWKSGRIANVDAARQTLTLAGAGPEFRLVFHWNVSTRQWARRAPLDSTGKPVEPALLKVGEHVRLMYQTVGRQQILKRILLSAGAE